LQKP